MNVVFLREYIRFGDVSVKLADVPLKVILRVTCKMMIWQTPAWVRDLLSLNSDPTYSTLVLVPHDGGQISFPALPLFAASSSLAQLVTDDMMDDPSR